MVRRKSRDTVRSLQRVHVAGGVELAVEHGTDQVAKRSPEFAFEGVVKPQVVKLVDGCCPAVAKDLDRAHAEDAPRTGRGPAGTAHQAASRARNERLLFRQFLAAHRAGVELGFVAGDGKEVKLEVARSLGRGPAVQGMEDVDQQLIDGPLFDAVDGEPVGKLGTVEGQIHSLQVGLECAVGLDGLSLGEDIEAAPAGDMHLYPG
ncbi:MAG: hypothetical protein M5U18_01845 [Dehalococcoidia bacterium]|nr:hypothetical protein [Dehalococcoidia bacterium]